MSPVTVAETAAAVTVAVAADSASVVIPEDFLSYSFQDLFTTTQAAPLTSPRAGEPGPGTAVLTDLVDVDPSITGGKYEMPRPAASQQWTNYGFYVMGSGAIVKAVETGVLFTDALRAILTSGDGRAAEGSYGFYPAATNTWINGGAETNVTGWSSYSATLLRATNESKFGVASAKYVATSTNDPGLLCDGGTVVAGNVVTVSLWVKGEGTAIGKQMRLFCRGMPGEVSSFYGPYFNLTNAWQRTSVTFTVPAACTYIRTWLTIPVANGAAVGDTFYVDGFQIEVNDSQTPYIETNGASATRTPGGSVDFPNALLDETQSWVAIRARPGWENLDRNQMGNLFSWGGVGGTDIHLRISPSANRFEMERMSAGVGQSQNVAFTEAYNVPFTIILAWTATQLKCSVNGAAFVSVASTTIPVIAADWKVGEGFGGEFLWSAAGRGPVTDGNAATIHALGDAGPLDFTQLPAAAAPIMLWPAVTAAYTKEGYARKAGLTGYAIVNSTNPDRSVPVNVRNVSGLNIGEGMIWDGANINLRGTGGPTVSAGMVSATEYQFATVCRGNGLLHLVRGGVYTNWTLIAVQPIPNDREVFLGLSNYNANLSVSEFKVIQKAGLLATEYGRCHVFKSIVTVDEVIVGLADALSYFHWTPVAGETLSIRFRRVDDNSCYRLDCAQTGGTIKLFRRVAGVDTELGAGQLQTWTAGGQTHYRIGIHMAGGEIRTFVEPLFGNFTAKHVITGETHNLTATGFKASGFADAANWEIWPRTFSGTNELNLA